MDTPVLVHASIADIREDDLVELLLAEPIRRRDMFEVFGVPSDASWKTRLLLDSVPGKFRGDIDILLCDRNRPHEAVAYEVKRVKFGMSALRVGNNAPPNKLRELDKAVKQANRLAEAGFWKVFLYIIVVVDSREQNAGEVTYEGLSTRVKSRLETYLRMDKLDPRAGWCLLDFTQPMDFLPLMVGSHGIQIRRMATAQEQSDALTTWVSGVFAG